MSNAPQSTDAPAIPQPLALPKFTFLCGPRGMPGLLDLALAIMERDPEMLRMDFEAPLRDATADLFFGGPRIDLDLTYPTQRNARLTPYNLIMTIEGWLEAFDTGIRQNVGQNAIGQIALQNFLHEGHATIFDRFIWTDCHNTLDADVFVTHFDMGECLKIHLGPMRTEVGLGYHCWLPGGDTLQRMKELEHELKTRRCP